MLLLFVCGGFGLSFFVAPFSLLAVFNGASAFNQDVSNWYTGAVIDMSLSKCTRSLSLSVGHGAFRCGVLLNIYDNSRFVGSQVSHVLFFLFCLWFEMGPFCCCLCGGVWSFFSVLHPSLFVQCFLTHLCSIRTCRNGIRGR